MKVLVLGGKGFIGRHAVSALEAAGATVTVGTRSPSVNQDGNPEEEYALHRLTSEVDWHEPASRYDVILNAVGILRQRRGETYDAVHHLAPGAIARACDQAGTRFVHVSALGLSTTARSRFLTSKAHGERAISNAGGNWYIARLSLLDGEGGYGASWLRAVSRLPIFVVPTSARGCIAALTAKDAGRALCALCMHEAQGVQNDNSRIYELGGPRAFTFENYIRGLGRRYRSRPALCIPVPGFLSRLAAHLCDVVHFSPFSFGHWELLCKDNVPSVNRLPELLAREPDHVIQPSFEANSPLIGED